MWNVHLGKGQLHCRGRILLHRRAGAALYIEKPRSGCHVRSRAGATVLEVNLSVSLLCALAGADVAFLVCPKKIRVVQTETGSAFGGKEEYPSMLAAHATLLAMKSRRPVKMIYDRLEDMVPATTKRHPSRTRHRLAVNADGKILGGEVDFTIDGGAYATLSSVVTFRAGAIHAGGFHIIGLTFESAQGGGHEYASRMGKLTAVSARRNLFLQWNGIWIESRRLWGFRPQKFGAEIS